jgi:predicted transcriptional regulator
VANTTVPVEQLPDLIRTVSQALGGLGQPEATAEPETAKPSAAQIRKSIRPDGLVSFIDGRTYKTLKRHLTTNGLTVAEYKTKFSLPADYPTTSPEYSAHRSQMAKSRGLGRQRAATAAEAPAPAPAAVAPAPKRGRKATVEA